jgi:hypothetical protein
MRAVQETLSELQMPTRIISPNEWAAYLDSFSRVHRGWLTTLEILRGETYAIQALDKPLVGISVDRPQREYEIAVQLGVRADDHLTHVVRQPRQMQVQQTADGADEGLDVEAADGTRTRLRFRRTALPEELDGFAPDAT